MKTRIILALLALPFACGCKTFADFSKQMSETATTTIEKLEASGCQYDADLRIEAASHMTWNPFGFSGSLPGSYFHASVRNGRGLAERPEGAGDDTPPGPQSFHYPKPKPAPLDEVLPAKYVLANEPLSMRRIEQLNAAIDAECGE